MRGAKETCDEDDYELEEGGGGGDDESADLLPLRWIPWEVFAAVSEYDCMNIHSARTSERTAGRTNVYWASGSICMVNQCRTMHMCPKARKRGAEPAVGIGVGILANCRSLLC